MTEEEQNKFNNRVLELIKISIPDRYEKYKHSQRFKDEFIYIVSKDELYKDILIEKEKLNNDIHPVDTNKLNSLACYVLGFTNKEPDLELGFKFNTKQVLTRISPPDIDIDFEEQESIFKYIRSKYGEDHVAFISTFQECKAKKSVQMAFKINGITVGDMDAHQTALFMSKQVRNEDTFEESINQEGLREYLTRFKHVFDLAEKINGVKTTLGQHAAGFLATDKPLWEYIPVMKNKDGLLISEWDKDDVENVGLLKYDVLKLDTMGLIHETVDMVKEKLGQDIDIESVNLYDPKVFEVYQKVDTSGIFQMEKYTMRKALQSLDVQKFGDIVACNALGRPGPISEGYPDKYGERQKQPLKISYYHPKLRSVLEDTFGLILYQEQVMHITKILAGFTDSEADKVRKFIAKKQDEEKAKAIRQMFVDGCNMMKYVDENFSLEMWRIMEGFGSYAFNKAHSTAYGVISYWTAWLKTYYYPYFMANVMNTTLNKGTQDYEKNLDMYYGECKKNGINIIEPDINLSKDYYDVVNNGTAIVKPFHIKKGIGKKIGTNISRRQTFADFDDFLNKTGSCRIGQDVIEIMYNENYFRCFGDKSDLMDQYHSYMKRRKREMSTSRFIAGGEFQAALPKVEYPNVSLKVVNKKDSNKDSKNKKFKNSQIM